MQMEPLKQKLTKLKSGSILITKEEREQVEKVMCKCANAEHTAAVPLIFVLQVHALCCMHASFGIVC